MNIKSSATRYMETIEEDWIGKEMLIRVDGQNENYSRDDVEMKF